MPSYSPGGRKLLDAATEAFYADGIRAIGVDTITERAGVSKPTLYAQFGSKENLVAAVLERRSTLRQQSLTDYLAASGAVGAERVLAVFDWTAEVFSREGLRGCAFLNTAAELPDPHHPARVVVAAYKDWLKGTLTKLVAEAGIDDDGTLGETLLMLLDGASMRVTVSGDPGAITRARAGAARLLGAGRGAQ
jgi:AcrR family transcriptional regulator